MTSSRHGQGLDQRICPSLTRKRSDTHIANEEGVEHRTRDPVRGLPPQARGGLLTACSHGEPDHEGRTGGASRVVEQGLAGDPSLLGGSWAPLFTLMATTGLRRGEALGLRWSDVDLDAGRLAVRQTLLAINSHMEFGEPKTARSRRTVDLDAGTVAVLRAHRKAQLEERAGRGLGRLRAGTLVFTDEGGDQLHPNLVSKTFVKLILETELPAIRLHDLRHTHASLSLQAGVHVKVVSERLGHSSVTITLDTYSHAIPGLQRDAAEKVAALIPALGSRRD